jgi:hypothetical protein
MEIPWGRPNLKWKNSMGKGNFYKEIPWEGVNFT